MVVADCGLPDWELEVFWRTRLVLVEGVAEVLYGSNSIFTPLVEEGAFMLF
jgi:hypothetical protein